MMNVCEDDQSRGRRRSSGTNDDDERGVSADEESIQLETARSDDDDDDDQQNEEGEDPTRIRQRKNIVTQTVSHVVNPVIDCVDLNAALDRVDFNSILERIEWDRHLQRVDPNLVLQRVRFMEAVVDRIDWNEILLERVDLNRLLEAIDVERVVYRSNVQAIVAQSSKQRTSELIFFFLFSIESILMSQRNSYFIDPRTANSILANLLDVLRAQVIRLDTVVHEIFRLCRWPRQRRWALPPKPSDDENDTTDKRSKKGRGVKSPRRAADLAVAARGRCAGVVSRTVAYMIDFAIVFAVFVLWLLVLSQIVQLVGGNEQFGYGKSSAVGLASFFVLHFFYESLLVAAASRSIGKAVMGLLIVHRTGKPLRGHLGLYRSFLKTLPGIIFGTLLGLFRTDRRSMLDLAVCSTVIYGWDAEGFREREKYMDEGEQLEDVHADDESVTSEDGVYFAYQA